MKSRAIWYIGVVLIVVLVSSFLFQGAFHSALAGSSWFSKTRQVPHTLAEVPATRAAGDIGTTVFDIVISLYNDPSGDDNPDIDTGTEEQTNYEQIIRFWADAICEQSNQALKLGKVRIFRNGIYSSLADVVWNANEWPRARVSGFGNSGQRITFGDVFPDGCDTGCDINFLDSTRHEDGGYTLGHEFGHYVLGLYDEYQGSNALETRIQLILEPAKTVARIIFERQPSEVLNADKVEMALDVMMTLLERWDPRVCRAVIVIKPYVRGLEDSEIKETDLVRLLGSAIDKEFAMGPLKSIEACLLALKAMVQLDPKKDDNGEIDHTGPIIQILENRGMTAWIPAIQVERQLRQATLNLESAIRTLRRLNVYQKHGLLGAEPEDINKVKEELGDFTDFITEGFDIQT